jgi:hypothetical protein
MNADGRWAKLGGPLPDGHGSVSLRLFTRAVQCSSFRIAWRRSSPSVGLLTRAVQRGRVDHTTSPADSLKP